MRLFPLVLALVACHGSSNAIDAAGGSGDAATDATPPGDGSAQSGSDGTPTRVACTNQLGTALTQSFGRLDGFLVAIVPVGAHNCNGDSSHVHLQVKANNEVYDIAVNVGSGNAGGVDDVHTAVRELTLPAWSEGWHSGAIDDYVTDGVHSTDLTLETHTQIESDLTADLATANHISIFATGYGPDGAHLVHRNGNGHDGLVVTQPLSTPSHARLFSFTSQSF